jgi:hypothetical protein
VHVLVAEPFELGGQLQPASEGLDRAWRAMNATADRVTRIQFQEDPLNARSVHHFDRR